MKNAVTEQEVINAFQTHGEAVSVDDIAKQIGVVRHMLFPVIKQLSADNKIVRVENSGIPMFKLSAEAEVQPANEALQEPLAEEKPQKPQTFAPKVVGGRDHERNGSIATPKERKAEPTPTPRVSAPVRVVQPEPEATKPAINKEPQKETLEHLTNLSDQNQEIRILSMLFERPCDIGELKAQFGDCEPLLDSLAKRGLVEANHIIDTYVYIVTQKGLEMADELIRATQPDVVETESEAAASFVASKPVEQMVSKQPVPEEEALVPEAAQSAAEKPAPAVAQTYLEPEVLRDEDFSQEEPFILPPEIMNELTKVIEKMVVRRLSQESVAKTPDMSSVATELKIASVALHNAANAIDKALKLMKG